MVQNTPTRGKKLSEREHVLARPDMFIGSIEPFDSEVWRVADVELDEDDAFETRITKLPFENYNSGFSRIHIENFSNIIDNKWESDKMGIKMTGVSISFTEDTFRTENDGRWIPVELQEFEDVDPVTRQKVIRKIYPAQAFFTELRTGTNYNDEEDDRKTSGRNGVGIVTLTYFSKVFKVSCFDPKNKKQLTVEVTNNGQDIRIIGPHAYTGKSGRTVIECTPDFTRFKMEKYTDEWISYFKKHAYDMAMVTGVKVMFNSVMIPVRNLRQYAQAVIGKGTKMYEASALGCDVILAENQPVIGETKMAHISFVNGIYTKNGGMHVMSWRDKLLGQIRDTLNKSIKPPKGMETKKVPKYSIDYYANQLIMFVRCEVNKPKFDSQTKDELVYPKISLVGEDGKIDAKDMNSIMKWDFVAVAHDRWQHEMEKVYEKKGKEYEKQYDPKVRMANWANTAKRGNTMFYITEGDSAKTLIEAGCSYIPNGFDKYGSFPIRGKLPNAMKKSNMMIMANKEIRNIISALNLRRNVDYTQKENLNTLSHRALCIAADSDSDGSHILILVIAWLYVLFPTLFQVGFVKVHVFPKASKNINGKKIFYYREKDYAGVKNVKYYKGLGTFRNEDAAEFFENPKLITIQPSEEDSKWMNLALGSNNSENRKKWILEFIEKKLDGNRTHETIEGDMGIPKFIQENLSEFFHDAMHRAIPHMMDGMKDSQRKCIHGLVKNNVYMNAKRTDGSRKVITQQGLILHDSEYHHGDTSLQGTIIHLAMGYTGTNNIPWCYNDGQFGTRHGDAAAAARYIDTALDPIVKKIIRDEDIIICRFKQGEKMIIEPEYYPTVLPILLVNGVSGIAVGYASDVPCFNPLDVCREIKSILYDKESSELVPWYRGFTGKITKRADGGWKASGVIKQTKDGIYRITELPVSGKYMKTQNYKQFLWEWKKGKKGVRKINEHHTINTVDFEIIVDPKENLVLNIEDFKLTSNLKFNMWVVDIDGRPKQYTDVNIYLKDWCGHRLSLYEQRKKYWLARLQFEKEVAIEQARYISQIMSGTLSPKGKSKKEFLSELVKHKYQRANMKGFSWKPIAGEEDDGDSGWSLNYIQKIGIWDQTSESVARYKANIKEKTDVFDKLKNTSARRLWLNDIEEFEKDYIIFLNHRNVSDGKKR